MQIFRLKLSTFLFWVISLGLGIGLFGQHLGKRAAIADIEQVKLLWPDISTLPVDDRYILAESAFRCRLRDVPPMPESIKDCLRSGAKELEVDRPVTHATQRLEALIATTKK